MANKVYAVRNGRVPGLYATWAECEAQVKGFSGAEYKSFRSYQEAQEWLASGEARKADVVGREAISQAEPVRQPLETPIDPLDLPPWDLEPTEEQEKVPLDVGDSTPRDLPEALAKDLNMALEKKANAFIDHLRQHGIPAYPAESGNDYSKKIGVEGGGTIDLYHTATKPYRLRVVSSSMAEMQQKVERMWREFHWGLGKSESDRTNAWDTVDYYYKIFKPYAQYNFDFIAFAVALKQACDDAPRPDEVRYDFGRLEDAYKRLKLR